jgi:anti-sigma B factor antagonist
MFEATVQKLENSAVVSLNGDLSIQSKFTLEESVEEAVAVNPKAIALNFKNLRNIDSTGLGALLGIYKKLKDNNIEMMICDLRSDINCIFDITKLNMYFKIGTMDEFKAEYE